MRAMMDHPKQSRNVSVIARKFTLTDALVSKAGVASKAKTYTPQDHRVSIKSAGTSLAFQYAASPLAAKLQASGPSGTRRTLSLH